MNKKLKKFSSYRLGWKDADILVGTGLSVWAICTLSHSWGFRRKSKKDSHPKLYRYCEGFMDRLEKYAKARGIKIEYTVWNAGSPFQDQIGKELEK